MDQEEKLALDREEWEEHFSSPLKSVSIQPLLEKLLEINADLQELSADMRSTDRIDDLGECAHPFVNREREIKKFAEHVARLNEHMDLLIAEAETDLDDRFKEILNDCDGPLERLQQITNNKYDTPNQLGILVDRDQLIGIEAQIKERISLDDILTGNRTVSTDYFCYGDIFQESYRFHKEKKNIDETVTYDTFLRFISQSIQFDHAVDQWGLEPVYNIIPLKPAIDLATGKNIVTGEVYTDEEVDQAVDELVFQGVDVTMFIVTLGSGVVGSLTLATLKNIGSNTVESVAVEIVNTALDGDDLVKEGVNLFKDIVKLFVTREIDHYTLSSLATSGSKFITAASNKMEQADMDRLEKGKDLSLNQDNEIKTEKEYAIKMVSLEDLYSDEEFKSLYKSKAAD